MRKYLVYLIGIFFVLNLIFVHIDIPLIAASLLVFLLFILWILFFKNQKLISGEGFFSLLLTLSTFLIFETLLNSLPAGYFPKETEKAPQLVLPDRGLKVYEKNGFRGKRPCQDCTEKPIRIVTMGGSSTYGLPLYYSEDTYSAGLQRLLNERRPGENYEVLNGGIPGYGIMQIIDSLEKEVLKYKPDIVTVCAWFNDSSAVPSWYGFSDLSDLESYKKIKILNAVQKIPGFQSIYNSHLFAFIRYYLLELISNVHDEPVKVKKRHSKKIPLKRRMSPEEFKWGLEQIAKLSKKHNFLPVIVYEPVNRSLPAERSVTGKKYYDVMSDFAKKNEITLVNTLTDFYAHRNEWLYYDIIHPNQAGHALLAENIYKGIFTDQILPNAKEFLLKKGIDLNKPNVQKEHFFQLESSKINGKEIKLTVNTPLSNLKKRLLLYINSNKVQEFNNIDNLPKELTFTIPSEFLDEPIVNLEFKIDASSIKTESPIGTTGINSPAYIRAVSGGKNNGWQQKIEIDGVSYSGDYDGYSVVIMGGISGEVKDTERFYFTNKNADTKSFHKFISNLSEFNEENQPPIVIVTLKTDGFLSSDQKLLSETFKLIGGTGYTPQKYESFILIGIPGSAPGQAVELSGSHLLEYEIGKESDNFHKLLNISLKH